MKILLLIMSILLLISCGDINSKKKEKVGEIRINLNYKGERELKRVMVALYKGSNTNKVPDELFIAPKKPEGNLTFPYSFSFRPKKNIKYSIKLLSDEKLNNAPDYKTASFTEFETIEVTELGIDLELFLNDPEKPESEKICEDNQKRCKNNSVEICSEDNLHWENFQTCTESEICNDSFYVKRKTKMEVILILL